MTHRGGYHLLQMALILLKLELEVARPITEHDHGTGHVVVLDIDDMQSNNLILLQLVFLVLFQKALASIFLGEHLVEAIRLSIDESVLDGYGLVVTNRIQNELVFSRQFLGTTIDATLVLLLPNRQQNLLGHYILKLLPSQTLLINI